VLGDAVLGDAVLGDAVLGDPVLDDPPLDSPMATIEMTTARAATAAARRHLSLLLATSLVTTPEATRLARWGQNSPTAHRSVRRRRAVSDAGDAAPPPAVGQAGGMSFFLAASLSRDTYLGRWIFHNLVPALLYVLGAIILARITRWLSAQYRASVDEQVRLSVSQGGVASEESKRSRAVAQAIEWTVIALVYTIATILAIGRLGIPLTSLVAPATVAGVALGFGAQQVVADLLAGFFLFAEHQFGVGDLIELRVPGATTGISGIVEELTLRVTKLRNQQGEVIIVPNSSMRQVTNLSRDWSRAVIDLPVPATDDLSSVIAAVGDVARTMAAEQPWRDLIIGEPVVAGIETIEVDHVQLRLLVRTLPGRQFEVGRELRLRLATTLRELGVLVPTQVTTT
jgi:small-conductance mechanosensitive channel